MSLANISIVGNLAREPEQFQFASGRIKTTLHIAVNSFNKIKKEKTTDFYRVETWDRLAELANEYLRKGNQVAVSGKIAMEKWVDREGRDRLTPTVQASQLAFPPRIRPLSSGYESDPEEVVESTFLNSSVSSYLEEEDDCLMIETPPPEEEKVRSASRKK